MANVITDEKVVDAPDAGVVDLDELDQQLVGQFMGRCPREEIEYGGVTMRPGQTIMLCYGAANRDPEPFADPDKLDFNRSGKPAANITFGAGRHRCIGAVLVATNRAIMLRVFLQRARSFNVVRPEVRRHMSMATRGFDA